MSESDVIIEKLNTRGAGLGCDEAGRLPVPGTIPGEIVRIRVINRTRGRRIGRILQILEPSEHRVDPGCVHFPECPGCQWRHIRYGEQAHLALERLVHLADKDGIRRSLPEQIPFHPMTVTDRYRTRCVLKPGICNNHTILGMHSSFPDGSMIDMATCPNHHAELNRLIASVAEFLSENADPDIVRSTFREIRFQLGADECHRVGFVSVGARSTDPDLKRRIGVYFGDHGLTACWLNLKTEGEGTEYKEPELLAGSEWLKLRSGERIFEVLPGVWTPVGEYSAGLLLKELEKRVDAHCQNLLEIGCGAGQLSICFADRVPFVMGIDKNRHAIRSAERNSQPFSMERLAFRTGDAVHAMKRIVSKGLRFDTMIVHGMRYPFGSMLFRLARLLETGTIILVSPAAGSWIRDIAEAMQAGWELKEAMLFDQIPHTVQFLHAGRLHRCR